MERRGGQRSRAVFYRVQAEILHRALLCLALKQQEKIHITMSTTQKESMHANVGQQSQSCLPQGILCDFNFTHMQYLYSTEKLFQHLLQHWVYYFQIELNGFLSAVYSAHQAVSWVFVRITKYIICFFLPCMLKIYVFPYISQAFINAYRSVKTMTLTWPKIGFNSFLNLRKWELVLSSHFAACVYLETLNEKHIKL